MAIVKATTCQRAQRCRKGLYKAWLIISSLLLASSPTLAVQIVPAPEYQIKAMFLLNFAQFVEWPPGAFPDAQMSFVIGVLGADPFGAHLDEAVRGETVQNHPVVVQRYRRVEEIERCHILFISRTETEQLEQIFTSLHGRSILTVGDVTNFARRGGMIRFVTEKNKIRLRINAEAAKAANLTITSKLLRLAHIVAPGKD
jgi:hypothetical protein